MIEFEAIGTLWEIDAPALFKSEILKRIETFDKDYSRFRGDSLISQMAQNPGMYPLPDDAQPLLDLYKEAYDLTDGLVTPLIGEVLVSAGYDTNYSFISGPLTKPESWNQVLEYAYPHLLLKKPALLDFGAAGKGYLVDIIGGLLCEQGVDAFSINAGGDILSYNLPMRIGLENPNDPTQAIGVLELAGGSLCASAGNRRRWGEYHHIINPKTLASPQNIIAVWALASTALVADMLTTCLYFDSGTELAHRYGAEYIVLFEDYSVETSAGFSPELFTQL